LQRMSEVKTKFCRALQIGGVRSLQRTSEVKTEFRRALRILSVDDGGNNCQKGPLRRALVLENHL
jgi:hypothetical protein